MKKSKYRVRISEMLDDEDVAIGNDSSPHQSNAIKKIRCQTEKWQRRDDRIKRCGIQRFRLSPPAANDDGDERQRRFTHWK